MTVHVGYEALLPLAVLELMIPLQILAAALRIWRLLLSRDISQLFRQEKMWRQGQLCNVSRLSNDLVGYQAYLLQLPSRTCVVSQGARCPTVVYLLLR